MNPRRVPCPTCHANTGEPCVFPGGGPLPVFHHARIGAAETAVYGSPDAAALATVRGPSDQSLPPERDPAHVRADRPTERHGTSHDAYEDEL